MLLGYDWLVQRSLITFIGLQIYNLLVYWISQFDSLTLSLSLSVSLYPIPPSFLQCCSEACPVAAEHEAWHSSPRQRVGCRWWPEAGHVHHWQGKCEYSEGNKNQHVCKLGVCCTGKVQVVIPYIADSQPVLVLRRDFFLHCFLSCTWKPRDVFKKSNLKYLCT